MNLNWQDSRAEQKFPKTVTGLKSDELYPHCPRCDGAKLVFAYTERGTDFTPSRGEYFTCPLCSGTGEAEAEQAISYIEEWLEGVE